MKKARKAISRIIGVAPFLSFPTAILLMALGLYAILGRPTSVDAAINKHEHSHSEVPSPDEAADSCCDAE